MRLFSKNVVTAIAGCLITGLSVAYSPANTTVSPEAEQWHFSFAPYLWMSQIDGDVTVENETEHVHIPFSDVLKDLDFGAEAHFEANYERLTFMLDPTYLELTDHMTVDAVPVTSTVKTALVDGGIFYRIYDFAALSSKQYTTIELLGGARYLGLGNSIAVDSLPTVSDDLKSTAPIVGARIKYHLTPKTQVWLRGDVGGFNVDGMKNTWQAVAGFAYTIKPHIDIGIAYRVLKIDYADNAKDFTMNTLMSGPEVGISFFN